VLETRLVYWLMGGLLVLPIFGLAASVQTSVERDI